jgi:hypothetical protein
MLCVKVSEAGGGGGVGRSISKTRIDQKEDMGELG